MTRCCVAARAAPSALLVLGLLSFLLLGPGRPAQANCNLIPQLTVAYPSTLGETERALALPGDEVTLRLDLACQAALPGFSKTPDQNLVQLRFEPPGVGGQTSVSIPGVRVANCGTDPAARCDTLSFPLPGAAALDALLPPAGDGRGLAGPATILVTDALTTGKLAEVGPLYEATSSCDDRVPEPVFGHFVVLPRPTRYADIEAGTAEVQATLDGTGNALVPLDFRDVLVSDPAAPLFRLLSGAALVPAFSNGSTPIQIPNARYLRSFATNGRPIPPILGALAGGTGVFGSVDAPISVMRIARLDPDDPGGPPLYDLSDRLFQQRGPIVIAGASAQTRPAAFLADVEETEDGMVFGVDESIAGTQLNDDNDALDRVAHATSFATGATVGLGVAMTEVSVADRTVLPLAAEGGNGAFLVSEQRQGNRALVPPSRNGDDDWADDVLSLVAIGGSDSSTGIAVDPAPVVDGRTLVPSGGSLFFRIRENDVFAGVVDRVSDPTGGVLVDGASEMTPGDGVLRALSADGTIVAFSSTATNLVTGDSNGLRDVFVADRRNGTLVQASETSDGVPGNGESRDPSLSADGAWVAFVSTATNLDGGAADPAGSVFLVPLGGVPRIPLLVAYGEPASEPDPSGDGRFVAFTSPSTALGNGDDTNGSDDVFVLDRDSDGNGVFDEVEGTEITRISSDPFGSAANGSSTEPSISDDGRFVAFSTTATDYGAVYYAQQVVIADRDPDGDGIFDPFDTTFELVSATPAGDPGAYFSSQPSVDADGRFVAFRSSSPDLVEPPDADDIHDVFVRDTVADRTEKVSVDADGLLVGEASSPAISGDGRFVAFEIFASDLVFPVASGSLIALYDRLTNTAEHANAPLDGVPTAGFAAHPSISRDGRFVAFETSQNGLVPGDANAFQDVYVRGGAENFDTDLNGDLDRGDTVAAVLHPFDGLLLGPAASALSVAGGRALALASEPEQGDQNGDGDAGDQVLQLLEVMSEQLNEVNTFTAGRRISLGETIGCATTPERAQGPDGGSIRNDDNDRDDDVLTVGSIQDWQNGMPRNAAVAADDVLAFGPLCAASVPELGQDGSPIVFRNDDEDLGDHILALARADGSVVSAGEVVEDFAAEPEGRLLAFRTCEEQAGNSGTVLNGDGDVDDCVMRVLYLAPGADAPGELIETGFAAIRCDFPACATFFEPYRVRGDVVAFAAREADQSGPTTGRRGDGSLGGIGCLSGSLADQCDLTGDGDALDTVIVTWNRLSRRAQVFEVHEDAPPGSVVPFPTRTGGFREVLRLESDEQRVGQDCNGDGDLLDPCVVLVSDGDGDGVYDESLAGGDNAPAVYNPDQADADGDGLGDVIDPRPGTPDPVVCDVDRDRDVDRKDVERIFADRGMTARPDDPRDPNRDGQVTVADSAFCTDSCTRPDCSSPPHCGLGPELVAGLAAWTRLRRRRRV